MTPNENETISPKTPVSDTVPTEPQSISGVLTDEPTSSEPAHDHTASADDTLPEVSADGPLPIDDTSDKSVDEKVVPETTATEPTSTQDAEADIEIPDAITESAPITTSQSTKSPETGNSNGHVASSIDEAIADFKTAIKTPEPESVKASETLSATEIDETSASAVSSNSSQDTAAHSKEDTTPHANGSGSGEAKKQTNGSTEELSATAPRSVSASPAPAAKVIETDDHSEHEDGITMEEIEID